MRNAVVTLTILTAAMGCMFCVNAFGGPAKCDQCSQPDPEHDTLSTPGTNESPLNNWLCRKCKACVQSKNRPSAAYCPPGGHHQWNNLGRVGNTLYQCGKCSTIVESKDKPSSSYCPSGGHHQWRRLAN